MLKRILLITFEYPTGKSYCGGVGQMVKQCREALLSLGNEVYVLVSSEFLKKKPVQVLTPDGSLIRFPSFYKFQKEHNWFTFHYVIQHFVNWTKELGVIAKSRRKNRPKILYHFHSILRRENDSGFETFNKFLINQEKMIGLADKIICPSKYEYDNFVRYFPRFSDKISKIENTIEVFPPDKETAIHIIKKYGLTDDDIVSLFVGRLERIKGAHILIKNIPRILRTHKNAKIFVIGKTLEERMYWKLRLLQKKFKKQVFYIPYMQKKELFQFYYLSDIYINASLSESFSLSTHESAFCQNALLLSQLIVFDKFKGAALFFSECCSSEDNFVSKYNYLVKNASFRNRLANNASIVAKDFVAHNRLRKDFAALLKE